MGCFYLSAIVNNVAMNMGVQISVQVPAFNSFRFIPSSGIARSYGSSIFNILGTTIPFSTVAAHFIYPLKYYIKFKVVIHRLSSEEIM